MKRFGGLLAALALAGGAAAEPPPMVLFTVSGLRADALASGRVPAITDLAGDASWSGRALVASSDERAALASLHSGLRPWQHGELGALQSSWHADVPTLAEVLAQRGYRTRAFLPGAHRERPWIAGFDEVSDLGDGKAAAEALSNGLVPGSFTWVHFANAEVPYVIDRRQATRLRQHGHAGVRPGRVNLEDLLARDGRLPSPALRPEMRRLQALELAWVDYQLGGLLGLIRDSPAADRVRVVLTGSRGAPLGDRGILLPGETLDRSELEVPLILYGFSALDLESDQLVAQSAVAALLVREVGAEAPMGWASADPRRPILSEHFLGNGVNLFSLVEGEDQLLWTARFAPPEPSYREVQRRLAGLPADLDEAPDRVLERLRLRFSTVPPLWGLTDQGEPSWQTRLLRWEGDGGVRNLDDEERRSEMETTLLEEWNRGVPWQRSPERWTVAKFEGTRGGL